MLNNNILLSRSLFSKREKHQTLDGTNISTIFETDFSTIQGARIQKKIDTGNFKIIFNNDISASRDYTIGGWVKPLIGNNDNFWTYDELVFDDIPKVGNELGVVNEEAKLKINFSLLQNFAYFGSLTELIRSSITDIIQRFPASLWIRPNMKNGTIFELVNDFDIDLFTEQNNAISDDIKIFSKQYQNYEIVETTYNEYFLPCGNVEYQRNELTDCKYNITAIKQDYRYVYVLRQGYTGQQFIVASSSDPSLDSNNAYYPYIKLLNRVSVYGTKSPYSGNCLGTTSNSLTINLVYRYNDVNNEPCNLLKIETYVNNVLITDESLPMTPSISYHIKPKKSFVDLFFNSLNDFQSVLLNRYTNPRYTSNFKVPQVTEMGVFYIDTNFTWLTPDGWNLDIMSNSYQDFINGLMEATDYLDNLKTDNIYRMLTHESIKNMDWSFERVINEAKVQDYILGGTRIDKILRIYGRAYDELKNYIHGIEIMSNLSYDQKDNYPDIFLKSNLSYKGWQPLSLVEANNVSDVTNTLYYGHSGGYSAKNLELEFYRRLLLNSAYITRWKGTKHGLEMIMNLFGVNRDDWQIEEFAYVATGSSFCQGNMNDNDCDIINSNRVNTDLFQNQVNVISGEIREDYIYRVIGDNTTDMYITYPNDPVSSRMYYNGDYFVGLQNKTDFVASGGATVYMDELENLANLNEKRDYTLNGSVYFTGELSGEMELEYVNPDDLHDLCVERFFYGDFFTCPICGEYNSTLNIGGGIIISNGQRSVCPKCNGTGVVRNYVGVPVFKGNSEFLYYQQYGGWYQQTYRDLKLANTLSELFRMNRGNLKMGDLYYVSNSNVITDTTHFWVLINLEISNSINGWYNISNTIVGSKYSSNSYKIQNTINDFAIVIINSTDSNGGITSISVDSSNPGSVFSINTTFKINSSNGENAIIQITDVDNGAIVSMVVLTAGTGFSETINNTGTIITNNSSNAVISLILDNITGGIVNYSIVNNGSGYSVGDIFFVEQGTNRTAYGIIESIDASGGITSILLSEEYGYVLPDGSILNIQSFVNIKDIMKGNNPHGGDKIDDGFSYLQNFGYNITYFIENNTSQNNKIDRNQGLFKYIIDNSPECMYDKIQYQNMIGKGFIINEIIDTKKCWGVYNKVDNLLSIPSNYDFLPNKDRISSISDCIWRWSDGNITRNVDLGGITNSFEYYRMINTKKLRLTYNTHSDNNKVEEFNNKILPYIEEMLPSSAIVELNIN